MTDQRYHSIQWRRLRRKILHSTPYCVACYKLRGIVNVEELQVDHIQSIDKGGAFFDEDNLQVLCKSHNLIKEGNTFTSFLMDHEKTITK